LKNNWEPGVSFALLLPVCSFGISHVSLVSKINWDAVFIMLASIAFEYCALFYLIHLFD
jgi:hypothetical protein